MLSCLGGCFEPWIHFPEVYPQNNQICIHVNEFLKDGYRVSAESIEVRFPHVDGSRVINDGTVGITDGYCKLIIMTGVLVFAHSLELPREELDRDDVERVFKSFRHVRCSYTHYANPSHHHLHALRIGHVTSEKQAPSALDYLGSMQQAVDLERRASKPGTSTALRDVLGRCIAEYNRMCSNKRHKIDTDKKK